MLPYVPGTHVPSHITSNREHCKVLPFVSWFSTHNHFRKLNSQEGDYPSRKLIFRILTAGRTAKGIIVSQDSRKLRT